MDAKLELVQTWLFKAQRDLASARKLSAGADPYLDVAIYLCQQAAEKAVKGFLVFHDQAFENTHDVGVLVTVATRYAPEFLAWREAAVTLTPYATEYRYPGSLLQPDELEFSEALEAAEALYQFVLSQLPPEVHL
jgi:HEPN domain-containing protein